MNALGKLIYTTDFDFKVYALTLRDKNSSRVSVEVYIKNPKGEMTDIFTIPKKDLYTKKTVFDFFFDLEGGLEGTIFRKFLLGYLGSWRMTILKKLPRQGRLWQNCIMRSVILSG